MILISHSKTSSLKGYANALEYNQRCCEFTRNGVFLFLSIFSSHIQLYPPAEARYATSNLKWPQATVATFLLWKSLQSPSTSRVSKLIVIHLCDRKSLQCCQWELRRLCLRLWTPTRPTHHHTVEFFLQQSVLPPASFLPVCLPACQPNYLPVQLDYNIKYTTDTDTYHKTMTHCCNATLSIMALLMDGLQ